MVTSIKPAAFYYATNLDRVSLPALTHIASHAFEGTGIATLDLPWENIVSIGQNAFYLATNGLPYNLTLTKLTAISAGAFGGTNAAKNTQLRTVSLPIWTGSAPTETGLTVGGAPGAFGYCSALTGVYAPELLSIPASTFQYCTALTELSFPKATSIGSGAFSGCSNLTKLDIGGAVSSLSSGFLVNTSKFDAFILRGVTSVPTLGASTFNNTRIASGTAYIYVPQSLESLFKVASRWSNYAAQIRAIEDYPDVCGS